MSKVVHTILILGEGQNTEYSYFQSIAERIGENPDLWSFPVKITVLPKPRIDDSQKKIVRGKSNRPKRPLNNVNDFNEQQLEQENTMEPVRYVRLAQIEAESAAYNEIWVVFDFDKRKHSHIKKAFELADSGNQKINIAYSNVAFERWILLHFEKNDSLFMNGTHCRFGKVIIRCGTNEDDRDCNGQSCVCGYLRVKYEIENTKGQESKFPVLEPNLGNAYYNAAWLRLMNRIRFGIAEPYDYKPYTDVDVLVKRLLQDNCTIEWKEPNEVSNINGIELNFKKVNFVFSINVENKSGITFLLKSMDIKLLDDKNQIIGKIVLKATQNNLSPGKSYYEQLDNLMSYAISFTLGDNEIAYLL